MALQINNVLRVQSAEKQITKGYQIAAESTHAVYMRLGREAA